MQMDNSDVVKHYRRQWTFAGLLFAIAIAAGFRATQNLDFELTYPKTGQALRPNEDTIEGKGEPNVRFRAYDKKQSIGTGTVDSRGRWKVQNNFTPGPHSVELRILGKGDREVKSVGPFEFRLDWSKTDPPRIGTPGNGDKIIAGKSTPITGKAAPKSKVEIFIDNKRVDVVTADEDGDYAGRINTAPGPHNVTVRNKETPGAATTITIEATRKL